MQLRRFLVHFAWTIPEIQVNEEKHRVTQLPSFLTYSFYLLYLLTLINFFKPACHGRRYRCFRKPIKLSHCIYVYTDINFFYAYKWDCNGTNGVSHLLLCSPISSYPGDKLIVTNWYFYTPFRILRRIFSVCTRERSFYSRVLTCNRDIYDGSSIDAHGSLFTVLRKVQLASEKISFPSSSPPPPHDLRQAKFQHPGFRRLSSGIGPWRRRCKFVANSANAQDQRIYIHTFHLSVHLKSSQSWDYEIIMSKSQGVFVRFIATFYFARLPRTGLRYVIATVSWSILPALTVNDLQIRATVSRPVVENDFQTRARVMHSFRWKLFLCFTWMKPATVKYY